jgi:hypothetical protein
LLFDVNNFPENNNPWPSFPKAEAIIPGSNDALHTRTANIDINGGSENLVGIVWCDANGNAQVYFGTWSESAPIPPVPFPEYANGNLLNTTTLSINDPGYEVGYPDISLTYTDETYTDVIATVVYQRRQVVGNNWELVYKRYYLDDFTTLMPYNISPVQSLGIGKVPAIDAFVEVDKLSPDLTMLKTDKQVIAFSNEDGYHLHIIDRNDIILKTQFIPITSPTGYNADDHVNEIDVAAVCRLGLMSSSDGSLMPAKDIVYMIYSLHVNDFTVASWEVEFTSSLVDPVVFHLNTMIGTNQANRCKIEAMSIQDYYTADKQFVALAEIDCSGLDWVVGYNTGVVENFYLPIMAEDVSTPSVNGYFNMRGFDIAAGIGEIGNQNYYNNRHYSAAREVEFLNPDLYLFRLGFDRVGTEISHTYLPGIYAVDNVATNTYQSPLGYGCFRTSYWLENVSTSSSINSGKFLVKTWIDKNQGVVYKCFNAEDDITLGSGSSQWMPALHPVAAVYPNPAQDVLMLNIAGDKALTAYHIYDLTGRLIQSSTEVSPHITELNISTLHTGVYTLELQYESGDKDKHKFVKE